MCVNKLDFRINTKSKTNNSLLRIMKKIKIRLFVFLLKFGVLYTFLMQVLIRWFENGYPILCVVFFFLDYVL